LERVRSGETTLEEVERVLGGAESVPASSAAAHVLVVDDDAVTRAIARGVLEKAGYRVSESADGIEALERLREGHDFALMVLDVEMPRLGGAEVLDRIRRSVMTAGLPVIVLTGSTAETTEVDMMERGADDYVRKPLDSVRFVARVRAALRRAGG